MYVCTYVFGLEVSSEVREMMRKNDLRNHCNKKETRAYEMGVTNYCGVSEIVSGCIAGSVVEDGKMERA